MIGHTYRKVACRECEVRYQQHLEDCKRIDTLKLAVAVPPILDFRYFPFVVKEPPND